MKQSISLFLTGLLFSHAVVSDVIDIDWQIVGDANSMYDTETYNQWLDLSITANMTHDSVVANLGVGKLFEGWRLATQAEVLELWSHANISNIERVWATGQYNEIFDLVTRLGPTTMFEEGLFIIATHAIGMVEGGPELIPSERWTMELTYAPDGLTTRTSATHYTWDVSVPDYHYSTYLVKSVAIISDGDLAPWNNPDGVINAADLMIAEQLISGMRTPGVLQYIHGDMYPENSPDGIIDTSDLILMRQKVINR